MVSEFFDIPGWFLSPLLRFGEICYLEDKHKGPSCHIKWFAHGSQTILRDTAHPQILFHMERSCGDVLLASIYQKCHIRHLLPGQEPPMPDSRSAVYNDFYLRWV